ncbi:MAG: tetratricopeptide repeat protein [Chlorobi bacterium]|nr:tetratricopeptide repeat protein [Chlorobiota bacterium]
MIKISHILVGIAGFFISCSTNQNSKQLSENNLVRNDSIKSIEQISQEIRKNPLNANLFVERSKLLILDNKIDEAINDLEIAVKIDSLNTTNYIHLADLYLKIGKSGKTKLILEKCLHFKPDNSDALLRMANLYFYVKNYTKAMEYINKAQKVNRNLPQLYFTKGMIYKETGDTSMAIKNFQIAAEKEPEYYDAYMLLGLLYQQKKDSISCYYYKNAIKIIPLSMEAHYNLAMFYQENGSEKRAINEYTYILNNIDSLQPTIYFNLGYIYMQYFNEYDSAIVKYSKSIEINNQYTEAYYNRGYCYEQLKNLEFAKNDYLKALSITKNYEFAINGLNRLDKISVN